VLVTAENQLKKAKNAVTDSSHTKSVSALLTFILERGNHGQKNRKNAKGTGAFSTRIERRGYCPRVNLKNVFFIPRLMRPYG